MIKRVFFDIGDVLVHYQPQQLFSFLREKSRTKNDPKVFFSGEIFKSYELGEINTGEFFHILSHMFSLEPGDYELVYYFFGRVLKPDRDMITLKRNLKASGLKIGIISNNNPFHIAILQNEYPEVLEGTDVQIFSHKIGSRKPDKEIYLASFEQAGANPGECLLIDDRPENVEAFRKLDGIGYHYRVHNKDLVTNLVSVEVEKKKLAEFCDRLGLRKFKDF